MQAPHGILSASLAVEPLLATLRGAGLRVGVDEVVRLRALFAHAPRIDDDQRLLRLLRCVLVHGDEERALFERHADAWLEAARGAFDGIRRDWQPVPSTKTDDARLSSSGMPVPVDPAPDSTLPVVGPSDQRESLEARVETHLARQRRRRRLTRLRTSAPVLLWLRITRSVWLPRLGLGVAFGAAGVALVWLAWGAWPEIASWVSRAGDALGEAVLAPFALAVAAALYAHLRRRRWIARAGSAVGTSDAPARFLPALPSTRLAFLGMREQETLVWGIEHFVGEESTAHLDVPATVRATARTAGVPQPCFKRVRHARAVWLWVDASADDPTLGRLAGEIEASLVAHGLPVERAVFWGVPERLLPDVGRPFGPNEEDERRDAAQVAILTDGRLLRIGYGVDSRRVQLQALLRDLGRWPRLAVADFSQDDGLRPLLAPWGLELVAPRDLATWLGGRVVASAVAVQATHALRRQADDLAAACALAPAGSVDEGTALALAGALDASPWAVSLVHAASGGSPGRIRTSVEHAGLLNAFVHAEDHPGHVASGSRLERALSVLEQRYDDALELTSRQHWRMERELLRLWREPAVAAARLRDLYGGSLRAPIRTYLARLAPADRSSPGMVRLPWRWEDRTDVERVYLQEMGLGGNLPRVALRPPARNWIALGVCCGVGAATAGPWGVAVVLAVATALLVRSIATWLRAVRLVRPGPLAGVHGVAHEDTPALPTTPVTQTVAREPDRELPPSESAATDVAPTTAMPPATVAQDPEPVLEPALLLPPGIQSLSTYRFTVVTVDKRGAVRERREGEAQHFAEDLGAGVMLEMTLVPGGTFVMGSPADEVQHASAEGPQHNVTLGPFFLGRYPVTQAQWRAVARLRKVERDLNADPSGFKGDDRPVEQVTWHDAVEFCRRLARHTGRDYRLPSEAQWEYACRAGTTTPFHFGPTITPDLVNYDGNYPYGAAPKGQYRQQTTPVGSFGVANAFGLADMHGNVWEWCQDIGHESYNDAPVDGSAWESGGDATRRVLRGGAWFYDAGVCRSAVRNWSSPENWLDVIGVRVVCAVSRTQ